MQHRLRTTQQVIRLIVTVITVVTVLQCGNAQPFPVAPQPVFPQPTVAPPGVPVPVTPQPVPLPVALPVSQTPAKVRILTSQYPFCVVVTEDFANRFVRQQTQEAGPVRDFILGAQVVGNQQTFATTQLDFIPHDPAARFHFALSGTTNNQTTNYTRQAVVQSEGSYSFQLTKQVEFDGYLLKTWSPSAFMTINQRNRGAQTPVTGVPLLGSFANLIAITEAERRRPLAEQIAAQKVTQQVGPRFNQEIDAKLVELNEQLKTKVHERFTQLQLTPKRIQTVSTDDALILALDQSVEVPIGLSPPAVLEAACGVQLYLHQSHLNRLLKKLPLAGLEVPDTALDQLFLIGSGKPINLQATPNLATIVFDNDSPITASIQQGAIELEVRVAFRPNLGPMLPTQRLKFRTTMKLEGEQIVMDSQLVSVTPLDPNAEAVFSEIAEKAVRQQMSDKLQQRRLPARFSLPRNEQTPQAPTSLSIGHLCAERGWLSVGVKPAAVEVISTPLR